MSNRTEARQYYLFSYIWLLYLVFPFLVLPYRSLTRDQVVLIAVGLLIFLAAYTWGVWRQTRALPILVSTALVCAAIGTLLSLAVSYAFAGLFIFAAALAGRIRHVRVAAVAILLAATLSAAVGAIAHAWAASVLSVALTCLLVGFSVHSFARMRLLREEMAYLARTEERVRMARDVHDILGHTLSVIVLKAQVAHRLLSADPERARREIKEVEELARQSLAQIRESVHRARFVSLAQEIERVRQSLESVGIRCSASVKPCSLPPATETALSLVLREAATNVLRHSHATRCTILAQPAGNFFELAISDNGRGMQPGEAEGSGLANIRERVQQLGGILHVDGARGVTVRALAPLQLLEKGGYGE